jgi:tetratricopeptide (TPR) repeat protein
MICAANAQNIPEGSRLLTNAEAKIVARQALEAGQPQVAFQIAHSLIAQNPNDAEAHLLVALAARNVGQLDIAVEAAENTYDILDRSEDPRAAPLKFDAAMIAADALARQEKFTRAQLWVRRADQAAGENAQRRQIAANAYRAISQRNPLSFQLGLTIRPSNNINGGSDETDEFGGLTGSTEPPISGLELALSASGSYRFRESAKSKTEFYFGSYMRRAVLKSGYADEIPDASAHEFDFVSLTGGIQHTWLPFPETGPTSVRLGYSGGYYRNAHYLSAAELGFTQDIRQGDTALSRVGLMFRDEHRLDSPNASTVNTALSYDYFSSPKEGMRWSAGVTYTDYDSNAPTVNGRKIDTRLRLNFDTEIAGAKPDVSVTLSWRDLPDFDPLGVDLPNGRQDVSATVRLGLTYTQVSWYGFQPRLEIAGSITDAEVDLFDNESLSAGLTLVSRF